MSAPSSSPLDPGDQGDLPRAVYLTLLNRDGTDSNSCFCFRKPTTILFGSGEECDIRIVRKGVKDHHCSLILDKADVRLEQHDKAPVSINTDPIREASGNFLENEDLISISHRIFRINIEDPPPTTLSTTAHQPQSYTSQQNSYASPVRPVFSPVGPNTPISPTSSSPRENGVNASPVAVNRRRRNKAKKSSPTQPPLQPPQPPTAPPSEQPHTLPSPHQHATQPPSQSSPQNSSSPRQKEKPNKRNRLKKKRSPNPSPAHPPQSPSHQPPSPSHPLPSPSHQSATPPRPAQSPSHPPQSPSHLPQSSPQTQAPPQQAAQANGRGDKKSKQKPNVFIMSSSGSSLQWRAKKTPTSPHDNLFFPNSTPLLSSNPADAPSSPSRAAPEQADTNGAPNPQDQKPSPKSRDVKKVKKAEQVNRMSDDETLAINRGSQEKQENARVNGDTNKGDEEKRQPKRDRRMDEIAFLTWNNRHMTTSPTATSRQRKPTAFLRPSEDQRRGGASQPTRQRPPRRAASNTTGEEDADGSAPSDVGSPDVESPQPTPAQSPSRPASHPTPTKSQPHRRAKQPHEDLLIVSDSSPSPDPNLGIKQEPTNSDVARKGAKGNSKTGGKQYVVKKDHSLAKKIQDFMNTIGNAEENGVLLCSDFMRNFDKSDFSDPEDWDNYKKLVKSPICLEDIQGQMKEYASVGELSRDFSKLIQNARKVNAQMGDDFFGHVDWLEETYLAWSKTV